MDAGHIPGYTDPVHTPHLAFHSPPLNIQFPWSTHPHPPLCLPYFSSTFRSQLSCPSSGKPPHPQPIWGETSHGLFLCLCVPHHSSGHSCYNCRVVCYFPSQDCKPPEGGDMVCPSHPSVPPSIGPSTQCVLNKNLATAHGLHPGPAPSSLTCTGAVSSALVPQLPS